MGDTTTDNPTTRQSPNYTRVDPPKKLDPVDEETAYDEPEATKPDDDKPAETDRVDWGMVIPIAVCTLAVIAAAVAIAIQLLGPWIGLVVSVAVALAAFLAWWLWGRYRKTGRERRKARRRERGSGFDWNPTGTGTPGGKRSRKNTRGGNRNSKPSGKGTGGKTGPGTGKVSKGDKIASLFPGTRQNRNRKSGLPLGFGKQPKGGPKGPGRSPRGGKTPGAAKTPGLPKGTKAPRGKPPKSRRAGLGLFSGGGPKKPKGASSKPKARAKTTTGLFAAAKPVADATGRALKASIDAIKPVPADDGGDITFTSTSKGTTMGKARESTMLSLSRAMIDGAKKENMHQLEGQFYQLIDQIDGTFANLAEVMRITGQQAVDRNSVLLDLKPFAEGIAALHKHLNAGRPLAQALNVAIKKSRRYADFRTRMEDINGASRDVTANRKAG